MNLGGGFSLSMTNAGGQSYRAGVVTVVAAGNEDILIIHIKRY